MKLPSPLASAMLALLWLALNPSLSIGNLLLAALLALAIPAFTRRFADAGHRAAVRSTARRLATLLRLAGVVLLDVARGNVAVALGVLGPPSRLAPRFVEVPLAITDPRGIVALAGIVTLTPGTLSADLADDRRTLLVHAFHVTDEAALVRDIQTRYEAPLIEVFER